MGVVVGVGVMVVVVVAVIVVVESSSFIKLSFYTALNTLHQSWAYAFHQDKASSVRVPVANVTLFFSAHLLRENTDSFSVFATGVPVGPVFLLGLLVPAIVAACASLKMRQEGEIIVHRHPRFTTL
ncbi:hypothetical protein Tco_1112522 [Tanacetum coccineum]|uniref:Uncharacterized protein n=1 Tax=Tanacetum coccineum TaxID=301880 RepID=A0ABQ5IPW0_9ASTR